MNFTSVTAYADKLVREKKLPYLDICAAKGYERIYRYYTGCEEPATGKEHLLLYSATKPITAVCAMQLIKAGKLRLRDRVADYLPAYRDAYLLRDGQRVKPDVDMRIEHLLTMSAGLNYNRATEPLKRLLARPGVQTTTAEFAEALAEMPLDFTPGDRYQYSLCLDVMGAVIEVISGQTLAEYMKAHVFEPLEMAHTSFDAHDPAIADLYASDRDGTITKREPDTSFLPSERCFSGGGGVVSTVDDYARFAAALANGGVGENGARILGEEALTMMRTEHFSSVAVNNNFSCGQGKEYGYGYGVRVRMTASPWGLPAGEFGWDGAAGTYLMADPVNRISVVIGMHVRHWIYCFRHEHLNLVKELYLGL